jgi:sulfur-oxidizing protein SoxY
MNQQRRIFLKTLMVGGATVVAIGTGLLTPQRVWAAWPKEAFTADNMDDAMKAMFDGVGAEESDAITLKAPDIAENGAVVPISVESSIPNAESVSILVENNPSPLTASFDLSGGGLPDVSTRIKMGKTSNVIAMVKADGKLYMTKKEVKVTIGGCGG